MSRPQLFCFTYAGGSAAFFDGMESELKGIDVIKLEYAGHGKRHGEKFYGCFGELAEDMYREVESRRKGDYALFGYSMGSISAIETLRKILVFARQNPVHVFICAHEPHAKSELAGFKADELDEWVRKRTIRFGDVPEKLLNNKVFWRMYLPIYRADYTMIGKYEFEKLDLKTSIPVTVFYSETDTPFVNMKQWEKYFTGPVDYQEYSGNHFFIREHYKEMAQIISIKLGVLK